MYMIYVQIFFDFPQKYININIYIKRLHYSRIWIEKKRHCNDLHLFCVIHTIQLQQIIQIVTVRAHNIADEF